MRFEFATVSRIIFGPGTLREVGPLAKDLGRRALVVTGRDTSRAEELLKILNDHRVRSLTLAVPGEPEIETVQGGVALAKEEQCDIVIGFGGGSALDAGKAIAAMLTNNGEVLDYLEVIGQGKTLTKPAMPFIAIPPT